jgi:hypothetical protein
MIDTVDIVMAALSEVSKVDSMSNDEIASEIANVEQTLASLRAYRDGAARGSSKRADFVSSIKRLSNWRDSLQRKFNAAVDARVPNDRKVRRRKT